MTTKKKKANMSKKKPTKLYIIPEGSDWSMRSFLDLDTASDYAKDLMEQYENPVYVLEVTGIWEVEFPEEPRPEIYRVSLESFSVE